MNLVFVDDAVGAASDALVTYGNIATDDETSTDAVEANAAGTAAVAADTADASSFQDFLEQQHALIYREGDAEVGNTDPPQPSL